MDNGQNLVRERDIKLGDVGHTIILENEHVRIWEVRLEPGETIDFHMHYHPCVIISLNGDANLVETIFGDTRDTFEPMGKTLWFGDPRPIHRLHNKSDVTYVSRLIELLHIEWKIDGTMVKGSLSAAETPDGSKAPELSKEVSDALEEILIQTDDLEWSPKSLDGLYQKMLWRNEATGASIALIRFDKGVGIPSAHLHASNQFMYCLKGKYRYIPTGITLVPGSYYCNPKGCVHGPTIADEDSVFLEIYDGPHYPVKPDWYDNEEDAT